MIPLFRIRAVPFEAPFPRWSFSIMTEGNYRGQVNAFVALQRDVQGGDRFQVEVISRLV